LLALRRLLETNFLMYKGNAPAFVREPVSGHILLLGEVAYATASAQALVDVMCAFASQAKVWRKTFFVEDLVHAGSSDRDPDEPGTGAQRLFA
jgi:hypothetical protein